jgi:hypothetical protein
MPLYHLLLNADFFHRCIRPTLAASWQRRSFVPCRSLAEELAPAVRDFQERYHTTEDEHFLPRVAAGLPFDRALWRHLVGEVLWLAADEIPELQTAPESLARLIGAESEHPRQTPVQQAHFGARDLTFGAAFYRPDQAGYNDRDDVARLADYLERLDSASWQADALAGLPGLDDAADRDEELQMVREWFPDLCELYHRAGRQGQIVVCEVVS